MVTPYPASPKRRCLGLGSCLVLKAVSDKAAEEASVGTDGRPEAIGPIRVRNPVVARVLNMKGEGKSLRMIAGTLNSDKVPTREGRHGRCGQWRTS